MPTVHIYNIVILTQICANPVRTNMEPWGRILKKKKQSSGPLVILGMERQWMSRLYMNLRPFPGLRFFQKRPPGKQNDEGDIFHVSINCNHEHENSLVPQVKAM